MWGRRAGWVLVNLWITACSLDRAGVGGGSFLDASVDAPADAPLGVDVARDALTETDAGCIDGTAECAGDGVRRCVAGAWVDEACTRGCGGEPATCRTISPSNLGGTIDAWAGTANVIVPTGEIWIIDTDSGVIEARSASNATVVLRVVRGPGSGTLDGIREEFADENLVVGVAALTIERGARIIALGRRALVLVSAGDVIVSGSFTAVAALGRAPAGGAPACDGPGRGNPGAAGAGVGDGGGAGGSFGSLGGAGGSGSDASGGEPSPSYGTPELVPLIGGSGGCAGAGPNGGEGGNGGGAVQITAAARIYVDATSSIHASGLGGRGGLGLAPDGGGGGGGGSGGGVLLEAPLVEIDGWVGALGGAGGQGSPCDAACAGPTRGAAGAPGSPTLVPAPGSGTVGAGGGGGEGNAPSGTASAGGDGTNGGGGGGGAGRIRINADSVGPLDSHVFPSVGSGLATRGPLRLTP